MKKIILLTCFACSYLITNGQEFQFSEAFVEKISIDFCNNFNEVEDKEFDTKLENATQKFFTSVFIKYESEMIELTKGKNLDEALGRRLGRALMLEMNKYLIVDCISYSDYIKKPREQLYETDLKQYRTAEFRQSYRNIINSDELINSAEYRYSAGVTAFANGDFVEAIKLLESVVNTKEDNQNTHLLAYVYEKAGQYDKGIEIYNNLPKSGQNIVSKALIQRSKKYPTEIPPNVTLSTNVYFGLWETFETNLVHKMKSPQEPEKLEAEKDGIKLVNYSSGNLELKGLLNTTNIEEGKKKPAIVYLHGGFALGHSDVTDCQIFTDAGYIVFAPSYRGENGNDGNFELFKGEVDDAKAAIKWLQSQPYVDAENVAVFGHSAGGGIALMLSLHPDIKVKKSGGVAGVYDRSIFDNWKESRGAEVPFDMTNEDEIYIRLAVSFLESMERNHFLYMGTEDGFDSYKDWIQETYDNKIPAKLKMTEVEGDHFTSLAPAMKLFLKELKK